MTVIAGLFLYDVTDPVRPRLVCRATNTYLQLLAGNKIAYTVALANGQADIIWRDLTTGVNTKVAELPADPGGAKNWNPGRRLLRCREPLEFVLGPRVQPQPHLLRNLRCEVFAICVLDAHLLGRG